MNSITESAQTACFSVRKGGDLYDSVGICDCPRKHFAIRRANNKTPYFGQLRVINPLEDFIGSSEDLIFGPNPMNSSGQLTLIFELLEDQETYFEIFNPLGQLIYSKSMLLNSGFYGPNYTPLKLDLSDLQLSSGVYTLSTNINANKTVKQLLVP